MRETMRRWRSASRAGRRCYVGGAAGADPGEEEILVAVAAAGVNRPDVMQRKGHYPPPPGAPDIPGLEISGLVARAAAASSRFKEGDQVVALVPGGGYAEFCAVHESNALPLPEPLTLVEGAGLPETTFTVWQNVFQRGALRPGEWLLVHGGTSGIGTTAIQLAKAFGAFVVATAGSDEKCAAAKRLGADVAVNYKTDRFRRGGARGHRRPRRRRDPRHGGRRLSRPQPRRPPPRKGASCRSPRSPARRRRSTCAR